MSFDFEYCILGGGVIGSSAAYLLARSGASVVLLEQFELGHDRGSSHGESRITRYSYDHPYYVRMAKRAFPLWDEVMKESGEALYLKTGGIDLDEHDGTRIAPCISSLEAENVPHEVIDAAEVRRRYPQFQIPPHTKGLYQADTGILSAGLCVRTLHKLAEKHGAQLKSDTRATKIEFEDKTVKVTTEREEIKAKKLILSAGGWMGPLLQSWGVNLPLLVTQEQYAFFAPIKPEEFQVDRFPVFIHYGGAGSGGIGWYGFPVFGKPGVKSSVHKIGKAVTADNRDFQVDKQQLEQLSDRMRQLLPDAAGEIIHASTCLYTNSADTHFVIDQLPGRDNAAFFTGCSGHSFKFGLVIGEMLIDLVNNRAPLVPMDLFARTRFGGS